MPGFCDGNFVVDPEIIVFNLKKRYTGVSATVNALVPVQIQQWSLAYCGTPLPHGLASISVRQAIALSRQAPVGRRFRIWHVRRDHEMMLGLWVRDVLRLPIKLVFTSAAQHRHGWFPRWLIARMDAVISTTSKAASYVPNTTAVVPHGIDLRRFAPPQNKFEAWSDSGLPGRFGIGVFGRVRDDKGTDVFVDAMIEALPKLPDVTAVIAGLAQPKHHAYQQALLKKIADAHLSERIIFLGEVPAAEIHRWYQRCLICVACPRYEPFGLTPFEAAATECALICSRTGAFEDLIEPGIHGELVDTGDPHGLALAVQRMMQNPAAVLAMGEAARGKVASLYTVAQESAGIGAVYQKLLDESR